MTDNQSPGSSRKIIYDFGANNGDDIPYYLKKAELVVAVEANPALCHAMEERFAKEIQDGRLCVENCVIAASGSAAEVYFYLHNRHHVLGQFPQPDPSVLRDFTKVLLPCQSALQIVERHGPPHYIKIDIEGYEEIILKELFKNGIRPPFISAESHSIKVFALLAGLGEYAAFKLVDGASVSRKYRNHRIAVDGGSEYYSFPPHSAGPFGDDVDGAWLNADDLFALLSAQGLGWKDIHATNLSHPAATSQRQKRRYMLRHFRGWLRAKLHSKRHETIAKLSGSNKLSDSESLC